MRLFRPALLPAFLATSLAAQTPGRQTARALIAPRQTAALDVAALVDDRTRVGLEPLVFGRWAIGLTTSFTRTANQPEDSYVYGPVYRDGVDCSDVRNLCAGSPPNGSTGVLVRDPPICIDYCFPQYPGPAPRYRAWSLDLSARYYPAVLSFSNPRQKLMVFVGEFVGYHRRRVEQNVIYYYGCPYCEVGNPLPPPDTGLTPPPDTGFAPPIYIPPSVSRFTQNLRGWEPGVEIGVRLIPASPVFIDVGGWFKLVTVDDPMQRIRPGDVDSRFVVAVGIGW